MIKVTFLPMNIIQTAATGDNLLDLATKAGLMLDVSCGRQGTCGKCKLRILSGNVGEPDCATEAALSADELSQGYRLACRSAVIENLEVLIPEQGSIQTPKTRLQIMPESFKPDHRKGNGGCCGVAFDIGTTTVVGMLWNLSSAEMLGAVARTNPQNLFGADVISRIQAVMSDPGNLEKLQSKIMDCLNEIIEELCSLYTISKEEICEVTIVGNTTMSHLLLGVNPSSLAQAPFAPVFSEAQHLTLQDLGLHVNPQASIELLPNIAGHVGSDIVGVLLASGLQGRKGLHLAIDIGTNGEILLAKDGQVLACSTAAGPAFEGAQIQCGMRAAEGAIEEVIITGGDVHIQIIGSAVPKGICGSGLIDAMAQLLCAGLIDKTGRLMDQETAARHYRPAALIERLRNGEKGREFVLAFRDKDEDIVLTQKDIREVQLAKGAIASGIVIMLDLLNTSASDIETISLAGAFGNYIRKESALRIGLFPEIPMERLISLGNAAGTGACMALLSEASLAEASTLALQVTHVELAGCPDFQTQFINAMGFSEKEGEQL